MSAFDIDDEDERIREDEIEYQSQGGWVTIIQDPENVDAWLQSTLTTEIRR